MQTIKLIIFDLDGTLINAYPAICQSFNYVMGQMGFPRRNHATIRRAVGWGERELMVPFLKPQDLDQALKLYRRHHVKLLKSTSPDGRRGVRLMPGARRLLNVLKKKGYTLAVATNRPTRTSLLILKHLDIKHYFDHIVCGDQLKKFKPDPGMLKHILAKSSLKPRESLYVGDMVLDVQTGKRARIKTVAVATGSCTREEIMGTRPFRTIDHVSKVSQIVEQLNARP